MRIYLKNLKIEVKKEIRRKVGRKDPREEKDRLS